MKSLKITIVSIFILVVSVLTFENIPRILEDNKELLVINDNEKVSKEEVKIYLKRYIKILRNDKYIGYIQVQNNRYDLASSNYNKLKGRGSYTSLTNKLIDGKIYELSAFQYSTEKNNYGSIIGSGNFYIINDMEDFIGTVDVITDTYGEGSYLITEKSYWDNFVVSEFE